jgi:5-methyltetrahydropteroyltriglutamate--homocysteine methyltransferase
MSASAAKVHRAEVVGSMLRPRELIEARHAMRAGAMPADEYRAVEDAAVDAALRLQEETGVDVVTDGEMRRDVFFGFFITGMRGLAPLPAGTVRFHSHDNDRAAEFQIPFSIVEKIEAGPCPGVEEWRYASTRTSLPIKVTLPSPMMVLGFWSEHSRLAYPDPFDLAYEVGTIVQGWMRELADVGCEYIQIDAPELNEVFLSSEMRGDYATRGIDPDRFVEVGTEILAGLGDLDLPGVTKGVHVCKGNGTQSWIAEGGYEAFAGHMFERISGFDVFHFEYDDERSGGFEPLAQLPEDKVVALGLVSTKWNRLEDPSELRRRIEDAARFHPLNRLALAPQCGFASAAETAEERLLSEHTQRDKLTLVTEVAREVWPS